MKRYLSAGLLLCSIILLFFSVYRTSDRLRYSDLLIVESEYKKITDTHASTTRELLTGLSLNNTPSFYDELTGSWFYSVPSHDTEALDPTIGFTPPRKRYQDCFFQSNRSRKIHRIHRLQRERIQNLYACRYNITVDSNRLRG